EGSPSWLPSPQWLPGLNARRLISWSEPEEASMSAQEARKTSIDLLFLGSGNAFAAEGRSFSSFIVNGRFIFDVGPTVLQQLRRAGVNALDLDVVLISHFHGDHFF